MQHRDYSVPLKSLFVRLIFDQPVDATPFVIKGLVMRTFPNEKFVSFINGELHGVYLYPRIQVKVLRKQLCVFAVNEGISPTRSLLDKLEYLEIEGNRYTIIDRDEKFQEKDLFTITPNQYHKYKFITPWVALNERQLAQYEPLFSNERRMYLNNLLVKNLEFVADNLGRSPSEEIQVRFTSSSLTPKTIEYSKYGSFKGYFTSNLILPDYLGLGNSISKGLGTLIKLEDIRRDDEEPEDKKQNDELEDNIGNRIEDHPDHPYS